MYYSSVQVVTQEVPDEVSLAFSISGCSLQCPGCHSSYTWKPDYGKELTEQVFLEYLKQYQGLCSCILFYGGEWHREQLQHFLQLAKDYNYKTCLYTGLSLEFFTQAFLSKLTYIKTGRYVRSLGGLSHPTTNQRMYVVSNMQDITHHFWRQDANPNQSAN